MKNLKVKIITMYSGESEFDACISAVNEQICNFYFEQSFIKNKAKPEAHNELYQTIMSESDRFDYFVKLDADMIFKKKTALNELISMAVKSNADIFSIPVHDYMTDSMIWGLNVYKAGVRWVAGTDNLFTDQQKLKGNFVFVKNGLTLNDSLVSHAENPNEFQSFVFGVHRAAKIVQEESNIFLIGHAWSQLNTLSKVVSAYEKYKDKKRALAIIGAFRTLKKINKKKGLYIKEDFFDDFKSIDFECDLKESMCYFRQGKAEILFDSVGYKRLFLGILVYLKRKMQW